MLVRKLFFGFLLGILFLFLEFGTVSFFYQRFLNDFLESYRLQNILTQLETIQDRMLENQKRIEIALQENIEREELLKAFLVTREEEEQVMGDIQVSLKNDLKAMEILSIIKEDRARLFDTEQHFFDLLPHREEQGQKIQTEFYLARQYSVETLDAISALQIHLQSELDQLFELLYDTRHTPIVVGLALVMSLVVILFFLAIHLIRRIRSSLINLKEATEKVAAGQRGYQAKVLYPDEIGTLTNFFNKMTTTLSETLISKSLLEEKNRELEQFSYAASHDLKAPLRGIGQVVDWMYSDFVDRATDEQKENMMLMKARVGRMNDLIDGLLRYARIGRVDTMIEKVDLQKLVADVIDSLQPPADIKVLVEGAFPTVFCVYIQIEQVFQNLISNAIRHMGKKTGKIEVICRDNRSEWVFAVKDDGPGIPKEHFDRIFQIFQTLKPRDEVESTGIGLSIVKKVVELHRGRVWVESQIGKGSTFFFSLPKEVL